jgi:signal transduction histidine kinase
MFMPLTQLDQASINMKRSETLTCWREPRTSGGHMQRRRTQVEGMSNEADRSQLEREVAVLHLASNPNDTFLLREELNEEGIASHVQHACDVELLERQLAERSFDVLVADLPLPPNVRASLFDDLSANYPVLSVVFRWGSSGQWQSEAPSAQIARSIRQALERRPDRPQTALERRNTLTELVRQKQHFLELAKQDQSDFEPAIQRITMTLASMLRAARVSVWEFSEDDDVLRCIDLYDAKAGEHSRAPELRSVPRYVESLRSSLTLAAHDARQDPRTSEFLEQYLVPMGITAMLDAPVRRGERVVGVVCHEHVGAEPRHWNLLEECAAAAAADLVARVMEVRDRRRAEERVARLERLEAVGKLASGVAHDLNNMLLVVMGNLELALGPASEVAKRDARLAQVRESTFMMRDLVSDLLDVGREGQLQRQSVELRALLLRMQPLLRASAGAEHHMNMKVGEEPVTVEADPSVLTRVLLNLVKNANEAMPAPGRVDIALSTLTLARETEGVRAGQCAVISVSDSGIGMDECTLAQLFQPFYTTKGNGAGHGLGLATSYGLVRQLGGTIRATSTPKVGSRFEVLLPLSAQG